MRDPIGMNKDIDWARVDSLICCLQSANAYMLMKGKDPCYLYEQVSILRGRFYEIFRGFETTRVFVALKKEMEALCHQADLHMLMQFNKSSIRRDRKLTSDAQIATNLGISLTDLGYILTLKV